jgi:hypothetical protein
MNILKIKNQKSGGTLALFEKDSYLSVSESVSEKAKLIRGDPPKIDFKKKGEPHKNDKKNALKFFFFNFSLILNFLIQLIYFVYFIKLQKGKKIKKRHIMYHIRN